jgi:acetate kinase
MGGTDAIIFTGGIGENSPAIRQRICAGLEWVGLIMDDTSNALIFGGREGKISAADSRFNCLVIPTNEELLIARDTVRCIKNAPRRW